jgi:hypothetical protein
MKAMPRNPRLRRRNGVHYFRVKVPAELVPMFDGKREVTYSLKTSDAGEANRLCKHHSVKFDEECDTKRGIIRTMPDAEINTADIPKLADAWEAHLLEESEEARIAEGGARHHRKVQETLDIVEPHLRKSIAMGDIEPDVAWEMEDFLTSQEFRAVAGHLLRARPAGNSALDGLAARCARFPGKADKGVLYSVSQGGTLLGAAGLAYRWRTVLCTDLPADARDRLLAHADSSRCSPATGAGVFHA